jgi:histidinol-phosphate aminotransferase
VDEAYADFSGRSIIGSPPAARPNVIVGRTFAKAHGLAGLRVGALIAAPGTIARLRRLALPYRINVAAAVSLEAALGDRAHLAHAVADSAASRQLLSDACARLGFTTWPSEANFQLVRIGERVAAFAEWMDARGVRVRDRSSLPGCAGCVRITAGPVEHTRMAVSLMEEWHAAQSR